VEGRSGGRIGGRQRARGVGHRRAAAEKKDGNENAGLIAGPQAC
jgi:hypothetical protein